MDAKECCSAMPVHAPECSSDASVIRLHELQSRRAAYMAALDGSPAEHDCWSGGCTTKKPVHELPPTRVLPMRLFVLYRSAAHHICPLRRVKHYRPTEHRLYAYRFTENRPCAVTGTDIQRCWPRRFEPREHLSIPRRPVTDGKCTRGQAASGDWASGAAPQLTRPLRPPRTKLQSAFSAPRDGIWGNSRDGAAADYDNETQYGADERTFCYTRHTCSAGLPGLRVMLWEEALANSGGGWSQSKDQWI